MHFLIRGACLSLPVYDIINDGTLFSRGLAQVDTGGLYAFVTHEVRKECNVIAPLKKTLCKAMSEGMRVDDGRVDVVAYRQLL